MGDRIWWLPPRRDRLLPPMRLEGTDQTSDLDTSDEPPVPAGAGRCV